MSLLPTASNQGLHAKERGSQRTRPEPVPWRAEAVAYISREALRRKHSTPSPLPPSPRDTVRAPSPVSLSEPPPPPRSSLEYFKRLFGFCIETSPKSPDLEKRLEILKARCVWCAERAVRARCCTCAVRGMRHMHVERHLVPCLQDVRMHAWGPANLCVRAHARLHLCVWVCMGAFARASFSRNSSSVSSVSLLSNLLNSLLSRSNFYSLWEGASDRRCGLVLCTVRLPAPLRPLLAAALTHSHSFPVPPFLAAARQLFLYPYHLQNFATERLCV